MLFSNKGMPVEDEIVLCTITKIYGHAVFANLDEYNKSGMIHISEISPGRIRNIRDYVVEGKKVVCKVLKIDKERGHIDLSLRRVSESQKREKSDELKRKQKTEKILEQIAKQNKIETSEIFKMIESKLKDEAANLPDIFEEIAVDNEDISKLGLDEKLSVQLLELIHQRIRPPEIEIKGEFKIISFEPEGIDLIKNTFALAKKVITSNTTIMSVGGGKYKVTIKSLDYKSAEKEMEQIVDIVTKSIPKGKLTTVEFDRIDK